MADGEWKKRREKEREREGEKNEKECEKGEKKNRARECILTTRGISHWSARCTRGTRAKVRGDGSSV